VKRVLASLQLSRQNFLGVHLRKMEDQCLNAMKKLSGRKYSTNLLPFCNISIGLVQDVQETLSLKNFPLFYATDGQKEIRDKEFSDAGGVTTDWNTIPKDIFSPALDMFLLREADVFIGNPASSFSSLVSQWRVANRKKNKEILSWPQIYTSMTVDSFYDHPNFEFWCKKDSGK
jgi:hypothetical protein